MADEKNAGFSGLTPQRPLLLAGATATGKSEVALLLAERLGGEIISVDSMQVYRGLDIGTAKPSAAERARARHHLIDVAELTEAFDAARFARLAHAAVKEIQGRGRLPILCGGTGLYFKAFLEGLGDAPPADAALRAELEATPLVELLGELERRDPATFARIDRKNLRRVVRAVEVMRLTGKPFSEQRAEWDAGVKGTEARPHPQERVEDVRKEWGGKAASGAPPHPNPSPPMGARGKERSTPLIPGHPLTFQKRVEAARDLHPRLNSGWKRR